MRVLSFIPALLLAATSFVAAVPLTSGGAGVAASVQNIGTRTVDDAALAPYMGPLANATTYLQSLNNQLDAAKSGTPDVNKVSAIISDITLVISTTVAQLKAVVGVSLSGHDLTNLGVAIYVNLALVLSILGNVVAINLVLGVAALKTSVVGLLNTVSALVVGLQIFVAGPLAIVLGPVLVLVTGTVNLLLVTVGANPSGVAVSA